MKSFRCRFPFTGFRGYRQLHENGRMYVYLWNPKTNKRRLISLARYRMSVMLGRRLKKHEVVDHKDEDFTNDRRCDLQLLTQQQNIKKNLDARGVKRKTMTLRCPVCAGSFTRFENQLLPKLNAGKTPTCSKPCGTKFGHSQRQPS